MTLTVTWAKSPEDLDAARSLYRRAGFREVPGSPDFPGIVAGVDICMEMNPVRGTTEESRLA